MGLTLASTILPHSKKPERMKAPDDLECILFDLDGTLVDSAPDLIHCLNQATRKYGFPEVNIEQTRPYISYGAAAMIEKSTHNATAAQKADMLENMLDHYQQNVASFSQLFDGMDELLQSIERIGLKWGIVTNKRERFTLPLMKALDLEQRAACIISGDTTAYSKPHPLPMLAACEQSDVNPEHCIYLGDAKHDIEAGNTANMTTWVALYGYLKPDDQPGDWGADGMIDAPHQMNAWITENA